MNTPFPSAPPTLLWFFPSCFLCPRSNGTLLFLFQLKIKDKAKRKIKEPFQPTNKKTRRKKPPKATFS
jgi:hypothetical protein